MPDLTRKQLEEAFHDGGGGGGDDGGGDDDDDDDDELPPALQPHEFTKVALGPHELSKPKFGPTRHRVYWKPPHDPNRHHDTFDGVADDEAISEEQESSGPVSSPVIAGPLTCASLQPAAAAYLSKVRAMGGAGIICVPHYEGESHYILIADFSVATLRVGISTNVHTSSQRCRTTTATMS